MEINIGTRLKNAWNAFTTSNKIFDYQELGNSSSYRPDIYRTRSIGNERSMVTAIYNRIAIDVASVKIQHVRLDDDGRFLSVIESEFNKCLTISANIDQTGRSFIQDITMSMMDEGIVAIVPVDTTADPRITGSYDINSMRTGKIIDWYPRHVKVRVYNDQTGQGQELILPKTSVAIVENPLYHVMNEPNSTMQRLIRKINLLDGIDEQSSAGKLDLIIQLPYIIKSDARRKQAEERRSDIEKQLAGSKYGIAYTDGTEKVTQLNRPISNNLMEQIQFLTSTLHSQLGITQAVLDGTADEKIMLNYMNRSIEPMVSAIVDAMKRTFLTKTALTQNQSIMSFRDPFKLVPIANIAEIADKFTRNEIMTSNEIRQLIGMRPSMDPKADELRNKNLNQPMDNQILVDGTDSEMTEEEFNEQIKILDDTEEDILNLENELNSLIGDIEHSDLSEDPDDIYYSLDKFNDYLEHYASPYYNPEKAHEYYMRTRQLKGRKSTSSLNDSGKEAAMYVKDRLSSEKKLKNAKLKATYKTNMDIQRAERKKQLLAHREAIKVKIAGIRDTYKRHIKYLSEQFKKLGKDDRKKQGESYNKAKEKLREQINRDIQSLRNSNKIERDKVISKFRQSSKKLTSQYKSQTKSLKDEYDKKYISELDKIKVDSKFRKILKRKRK